MQKEPALWQSCQGLYYNLYKLLDEPRCTSQGYIFELLFTASCDSFTDFRRLRKTTEDAVSPEALKLIKERKPLSEEQKIQVDAAWTHHRVFYRHHLWKALNLKYRAKVLFGK